LRRTGVNWCRTGEVSNDAVQPKDQQFAVLYDLPSQPIKHWFLAKDKKLLSALVPLVLFPVLLSGSPKTGQTEIMILEALQSGVVPRVVEPANPTHDIPLLQCMRTQYTQAPKWTQKVVMASCALPLGRHISRSFRTRSTHATCNPSWVAGCMRLAESEKRGSLMMRDPRFSDSANLGWRWAWNHSPEGHRVRMTAGAHACLSPAWVGCRIEEHIKTPRCCSVRCGAVTTQLQRRQENALGIHADLYQYVHRDVCTRALR